MRNSLKAFLLLLTALLLNTRVMAQYDGSASLSLGMGHGYTALSQSVMSNAFAATKGNKPAPKANNADYIYLGFSHYRSFEQKVFNQVLQNDKNTDRGKLRSFLTSARTMYHFTTRAQEVGLKDTYISDIMAIGIAWNWEMYHEKKASKQKVVALRNAIRDNIDKSSIKAQLAKLSDEDKRDWILSFMYNNSMLAQIIKNTGKVSPLQKQQLLKTAQQAGVPDISSVTLN
jgi:hypothetical protein